VLAASVSSNYKKEQKMAGITGKTGYACIGIEVLLFAYGNLQRVPR
jgi:hypothetical protein